MARDEKIVNLFGEEVYTNERYLDQDNPWEHWKGMPHYDPKDILDAFHEVEFVFETDDAFKQFKDKSGLNLTDKTKSTWYPQKESDEYGSIRYVSNDEERKQPKYPIYIISKGRWETRLTSDTLIYMGIKHYMVVEQSQLEQYKAHTDPAWVELLVLDQKFLDEYETCDDLGNTKSKGPGAARNFAWDHSLKNGHKRHWVMDDNMKNFYRLDGKKRTIVSDGAIIRAMEDFVDRYKDVYLAGPHYRFFAVPQERLPPFVPNCRIFSCLLIQNDIDYRWRGRYSEDVDLSIRIMKDGHKTIQFNAFLTGKLVTQALAGGNTGEFYEKEGTLPKSKMIADMHPDLCKVTWMNGRWHHWCNFEPFEKNKLEYIDPNVVYEGIDEYGMELVVNPS